MAASKSPAKPTRPIAPTLVDLEQYRFDPHKEIKPPLAILSLQGVPVCTPGNISNIQGQAKSAKSSVLGAAMAAMVRALTGKAQDKHEETMFFTSSLPKNTRKPNQVVLHFDTEQSSYHHQKLAMDILKRAGIDKEEYSTLPFHSYSLICIELKFRQRMITEKIKELEANGCRVACLVLDGVADIISDPNDGVESNEAVAWLHGLADAKKLVVLTILHENPGADGKARGHLGSQIQRKSETNFRVKKDSKNDVISSISVERARGAHIPTEKAIEISWCKKNNRHLVHDPKRVEPQTKLVPQESKLETNLTQRDATLKAWLEQQLKNHAIKHTPLRDMVMKRCRCGRRTAIKKINEWVQKGWIHKLDPEIQSSPYKFGPAPTENTEKGGSRVAKKSAAKNSTKKAATKKASAKKT